ncbi:MAG: hypothetical protein ACLR5Q_12925 [Coprococcus sp.]
MLYWCLFAYFYTSITFNPVNYDNMKAGGVILYYTGKSTSEYLNNILNCVFIGAIGLMIALIPILCSVSLMPAYRLAERIIIIVGVVLETLKQIEAQMCVVITRILSE